MTVTIEGGQGVAFPFDHRKLAKDVICAAIEEEGFPFEAEVGLLLATLGEIQEINLEQGIFPALARKGAISTQTLAK